MFFESEFVQIYRPWINVEVFYTLFDSFHREYI